MLRVFAEYQPFPFPLAPGEKIQPNCWQILLMSAVFAIFVYPLLYKLGKAGRANEKIRDYVPMTIGLILIGTEIYKQILMLYHFNWKYHFYLFPFQLCSVPMYTAALIPVIKNQKLKDSLFSFMAVYGMIGGLSVMIYQKSVLTWEDYSLNWHSIFWHLSLIALGIFSASYLRIGSGSFNRNAKILSYGSIVFVICVILAETFEKYGVKASIKWPNDILINGKKISGILAQTSVKNGELQGVVLGVGINLNMTQEELVNIDQPATSLNIETRKSIDKKEFSKNLFDLFFSEYEEFLQKGFSLIKSRYCSRCDFISKEICVKNPDKARVGIAQAINDDGSLKIKFNDKNESETIRIGDVTWNY